MSSDPSNRGEPLELWRTWLFHGGRLISHNGTEWAPGVPLEAHCPHVGTPRQLYSERTMRLIRQALTQRPWCPVVVLSPLAPSEGLQQVFGAGVDELVMLPQAPERVCLTLEKVLARQRVVAPLVCVLGPEGCPGKTFVATNLAVELAQRGERVVLVELDLEFGDIGRALGLPPTISSLVKAAGAPIERAKLNRHLLTHVSGLKVLTARAVPDRENVVTAEYLKEVLTSLRTMSDIVIVDTPPTFSRETLAAIGVASSACVVSGPDAASLMQAQHALERLDRLDFSASRVRLVVNRADMSTGDDPPTILGREPDQRIPSDPEIPRLMFDGKPITTSRPHSHAARSLRELADLYRRPQSTPRQSPDEEADAIKVLVAISDDTDRDLVEAALAIEGVEIVDRSNDPNENVEAFLARPSDVIVVAATPRAAHEAPIPDCTCGIYALDNLAGCPPGDVYGKVKMWGKVVPGSMGARGQYAYPSELHVPPHLLDNESLLAYGVPLVKSTPTREHSALRPIQRATPRTPVTWTMPQTVELPRQPPLHRSGWTQRPGLLFSGLVSTFAAAAVIVLAHSSAAVNSRLELVLLFAATLPALIVIARLLFENGGLSAAGLPVLDRHAEAERKPAEAAIDHRTLELVERRRRSSPHRRGWVVRRLLLLADMVGLLCAFALAELIFTGRAPGRADTQLEALLFAATLPAWVVIARLYGLYAQDDRRTNHATTDEVANVFHMVTVCTWIFFAATWLTGVAHPAVPKLLIFWTLAIVIVPLLRAGARTIARSRASFLQNTVIIGAGDVGQTLAETLLRHPEYGLNLIGFVDSEPKEQRPSLENMTILGPPEQLPEVIQTFDVERVIIAFSRDSHKPILDLIRSLKDSFVQVDIVPRYYELISPSASMNTVEGIPVVGLPPRALGLSSRVLKRMMDTIVSTVLLLLLLPFFLVIAALIKLDSRGPVFFRQPRVGAGGRKFSIVKFRTMVVDAEEKKHAVAHLNKHANGDPRMFKIPDDPRATRIGRQLRRFSIDELPQLWNVLCDDMSLVGPRPLIPREADHVQDWGLGRLDLKPGMTGLWQVIGRSDIPFEEMVRLDYLYVTNWSLWHDLRILCATLPATLRSGRRGY